MDPQRMKLLGRVLIVGGILVYLLALVGEILDWWNDIGTLLSGAGLVATLAGLLVSAWAAMDVMGSQALDNQTQMLDKPDQMLDKQDQMLEKQDLANEQLARVVTVQARTLEWQDAATRSLDDIEGRLAEGSAGP